MIAPLRLGKVDCVQEKFVPYSNKMWVVICSFCAGIFSEETEIVTSSFRIIIFNVPSPINILYSFDYFKHIYIKSHLILLFVNVLSLKASNLSEYSDGRQAGNSVKLRKIRQSETKTRSPWSLEASNPSRINHICGEKLICYEEWRINFAIW